LGLPPERREHFAGSFPAPRRDHLAVPASGALRLERFARAAWDPKTKALAGFHIEHGDDIEDTVSLMKATDFDPDLVDVLARGVKPGKTKKASSCASEAAPSSSRC
jgi:hypothetical protein